MISKRIIKITFPIVALAAIYFLGPAPKRPKYDLTQIVAPSEALALESYVAANEAQHKIKPNNEARIVWNDSTKQKTEYAVVYLHGFSASQIEGDPVHRNFAKDFGCNLYLSRLADHGIDTTETLLLFSAERLWESAKQALAIGKQLGDKVILVSTSTGGTLALMLAAYYPDDVHALINMSPNIAINDPAAFLLNDPWGLQIARAVLGGKYRITGASEEHAKFWNKKYRLESLVQLEELIETTMTKDLFQKVTHPSLTLYYYKNEQEQDPEVKVSAMLEMNSQLATPDNLKEAIAFPNAGVHVIGCSMTSKDIEGVYAAMKKFAVEKLGMVAKTIVFSEQDSSVTPGVYEYKSTEQNENHYIVFEILNGELKGKYFGSESEGEHGIYFYKADCEKLKIEPSGQFEFEIGDRLLYESNQFDKENQKTENAGRSRGILKYQGTISRGRMILKCNSEFNDCWDEELDFELIKN